MQIFNKLTVQNAQITQLSFIFDNDNNFEVNYSNGQWNDHKNHTN